MTCKDSFLYINNGAIHILWLYEIYFSYFVLHFCVNCAFKFVSDYAIAASLVLLV